MSNVTFGKKNSAQPIVQSWNGSQSYGYNQSPVGSTSKFGMTDVQRLFSFSGRANRTEIWTVEGLILILFLLLQFITQNFVLTSAELQSVRQDSANTELTPVIWLMVGLTLGLAYMWFAVEIRRFHDLGKSGWWVFLALIPIIGPIWKGVLLLLCAGETSSNDYGDSTPSFWGKWWP